MLIDFDYAVPIDRSSSDAIAHRTVSLYHHDLWHCSERSRKGTLPFMAIELIGGPIKSDTHFIYHDLESLIYVIIWVCTVQSGPNGAKRSFKYEETELFVWNGGDGVKKTMRNIWDAKSNIMTNKDHFEKLILAKFDRYFEPMKDCVAQLRSILFSSGAGTLPLSAREPCSLISEFLAVFAAASDRMKLLVGVHSDDGRPSNDSTPDIADIADMIPRRPMDMQWVRLEPRDFENEDVFR